MSEPTAGGRAARQWDSFSDGFDKGVPFGFDEATTFFLIALHEEARTNGVFLTDEFIDAIKRRMEERRVARFGRPRSG